jgi:hypothetical protein
MYVHVENAYKSVCKLSVSCDGAVHDYCLSLWHKTKSHMGLNRLSFVECLNLEKYWQHKNVFK